jgi:hypothetical protein
MDSNESSISDVEQLDYNESGAAPMPLLTFCILRFTRGCVGACTCVASSRPALLVRETTTGTNPSVA